MRRGATGESRPHISKTHDRRAIQGARTAILSEEAARAEHSLRQLANAGAPFTNQSASLSKNVCRSALFGFVALHPRIPAAFEIAHPNEASLGSSLSVAKAAQHSSASSTCCHAKGMRLMQVQKSNQACVV